jgi:ribosomal protein L7/L12
VITARWDNRRVSVSDQTMPREQFLNRLADVLRRSGVEDAEELIRLLEINLPAQIETSKFADVLAQIRLGNKIMAIKLYREKTGVGLKEAMDAVNELEREMRANASVAFGLPGDSRELDAVLPEITAFIREGKLIEAIKRYREATGLGLKESKDAVEAIRDRLKSEG